MKRSWLGLGLMPLLAGFAPQDRGFRRERPRRQLTHLEGRPAPRLFLDRWVNAPPGGHSWESLRGSRGLT